MHFKSKTNQVMPIRCLTIIILALSSIATVNQTIARPNIVLLLADDLGWADVGFHGSKIRTPSLDKLAADGVQLESFYVQPTCTPTRIALMTGGYPYRIGGHVCVLRAFHKHGVPTDLKFISELLQEAGYTTAITGKWHLGLARKAYWPKSRGFDICYGHLGGAIDYFTHEGYGTLDWYDNQTMPLEENGYSTDLIGDRAVKIIKEHNFNTQPLFLYVPFNAPHAPIQANQKDIQAYKATFQDKQRRTYAAMVTSMDAQIGRIRNALIEKGISDETLILFASDNGGHTDGAKNSPLRGSKGTLYEGGIRVPAVACYPNQIKSGTRMEQSIHIVDLFPTLLSLASARDISSQPLDGVNVWPAIKENERIPNRYLVHNARNNGPIGVTGAIRAGKWKLIVSKASKAKEGISLPGTKTVAELFDIQSDPNEEKNLAATNTAIVQDLIAKLRKHSINEVSPAPYCQKKPDNWKPPEDWANVPN